MQPCGLCVALLPLLVRADISDDVMKLAYLVQSLEEEEGLFKSPNGVRFSSGWGHIGKDQYQRWGRAKRALQPVSVAPKAKAPRAAAQSALPTVGAGGGLGVTPATLATPQPTGPPPTFDSSFSCSSFDPNSHFYQYHTNLPSSPPVKHATLESIKASRPGMQCFVESGTNTGNTVAAMLPHFAKVFSVESHGPLHQQAAERFMQELGQNRLNLFLGSSRQHLPNMGINSNDCSGGSLLWLDGHYSGDGTGGSTETAPVLDEIKAVLGSKFAAKNVVVVDDIRDFSPTAQNSVKQVYPSPQEVVSTVCTSNPTAQFHWKHDSLIFWFEGPQI